MPIKSNSRVRQDLRRLTRKARVDVPDDNNIHEFVVDFRGPENSPYDGGLWKVSVCLPPNYPYKSPSIGFKNRIFHPNVDELSGSICMDVINQTWTPMFDLINVFEVFLPQLLLYPNPDSPLNGDAANLLIHDERRYEARVREMVKKYAPDPDASLRRTAMESSSSSSSSSNGVKAATMTSDSSQSSFPAPASDTSQSRTTVATEGSGSTSTTASGARNRDLRSSLGSDGSGMPSTVLQFVSASAGAGVIAAVDAMPLHIQADGSDEMGGDLTPMLGIPLARVHSLDDEPTPDDHDFWEQLSDVSDMSSDEW